MSDFKRTAERIVGDVERFVADTAYVAAIIREAARKVERDEST